MRTWLMFDPMSIRASSNNWWCPVCPPLLASVHLVGKVVLQLWASEEWFVPLSLQSWKVIGQVLSLLLLCSSKVIIYSEAFCSKFLCSLQKLVLQRDEANVKRRGRGVSFPVWRWPSLFGFSAKPSLHTMWDTFSSSPSVTLYNAVANCPHGHAVANCSHCYAPWESGLLLPVVLKRCCNQKTWREKQQLPWSSWQVLMYLWVM